MKVLKISDSVLVKNKVKMRPGNQGWFCGKIGGQGRELKKKSPVETGDVFDCLPYKKRDNYQFINLKRTVNLVCCCNFVSVVKVRENQLS